MPGRKYMYLLTDINTHRYRTQSCADCIRVVAKGHGCDLVCAHGHEKMPHPSEGLDQENE